MASTQFFIFAILAVLVPSILASTGFDYQTWADGKEFHVSDQLVFSHKSQPNPFLLSPTNQSLPKPIDRRHPPMVPPTDFTPPPSSRLSHKIHRNLDAKQQLGFLVAALILLLVVVFESLVVAGGGFEGCLLNVGGGCLAEYAVVIGDPFIFAMGVHNVFKVNGTDFQRCNASAGSVEFTSGNDVIPLKTPGKKWYICGVPNHCANGNQKLAITVLDGQSPAPSPTSAARRSVAPVYYEWMVAFFSILMMVMV
ncbi:uncharacterized protein LOC142612071 [Castanea sativa]|uniref:uncharacterized protein LOC142612071 n=1 Tax=Castanea sativa TaxID=21020 RepID=UPI003F64EF09